jgi:hypothetical protein
MATHSTILRLGGAALVAVVLGGCSFRIQAPIREVAYDFSDRDFYDRSYAPSPSYAPTPQASGEVEERTEARASRGAPAARAVLGVQVRVNACEGVGEAAR